MNNSGITGQISKGILMNLVLVAVFWNSIYCVADELVAREYP